MTVDDFRDDPTTDPIDASAAMLDPRALERVLRSALRLAREGAGDPPDAATPAARALERCYAAYETPCGAAQAVLAREALAHDPDCPEAFELLAESEAAGPAEARAWFQRAIEAGERRFGAQALRDHRGSLYGQVDARVILRSKAVLGHLLAEAGEVEAAIRLERELLRLDREDHLGARYDLLIHLLQARCDEEALALALEDVDVDEAGDVTAGASLAALLARACALFRLEGGTNAAAEAVTDVLRANRFFLALYLSGGESCGGREPGTPCDPASAETDAFDEAVEVHEAFAPVFADDATLVAWLTERLEAVATAAVRSRKAGKPSKPGSRKP